MTEEWHSFTSGDAKVSYGQPFYGKPRIIANAPLHDDAFQDLIQAITYARDAYGLDQAEREKT